MEIAVLNAGVGDYKAEFDTEDELARQQLEEFIGDMLRKGYALFLEDGEETHRILSYSPSEQRFEVVSQQAKSGRAIIRVAEERQAIPSPEAPEAAPARRRGRPRRVTAVAPGAGG